MTIGEGFWGHFGVNFGAFFRGILEEFGGNFGGILGPFGVNFGTSFGGGILG